MQLSHCERDGKHVVSCRSGMTSVAFAFSSEEYADLTGRQLDLDLVAQTRKRIEEINQQRDKYWRLLGYAHMMFIDSAAALYKDPSAWLMETQDEETKGDEEAAARRCIFFWAPKYVQEAQLELKLDELRKENEALEAQQAELKKQMQEAQEETRRLQERARLLGF